jgi:hypothetical protein
MTVRPDYEVSSEGGVRHWEFPQARLENNAPVATEPAAVTSILPGTQLTGTVLTVDADDDTAVIDLTCSMVYRHYVRNVLTYNGGNENTFGAINIGDPVYYDGSNTMPADTFLSTSPLDRLAAANPVFGFVVPMDDVDMALYPKGGATASTQTCGIMQVGAGH